MIIIFEIKGKQYRCDSNKKQFFFIDFDSKLKEGEEIENEKIRVLSKDEIFGQPYLPIILFCKIICHGKRKKIRMMKYKAKKRNAVKKGFRPKYTKMEIVGIEENGEKTFF